MSITLRAPRSEQIFAILFRKGMIRGSINTL